ncbi:probable leucine-rich repeat receptor-like serine/threonine-protein kinase At3g14840 isoform X3 [Triticum dicoccoides]|uniref:probable leucine-rich repeat receptor-like serine/threonine-protein kinase At3g14840 isoform X3 n=1 Tax=Triticum dicoccoides TaxID=85692 RepID=UPI00188EFE44|nr:probable leucine-rich repeat receptor-like serine/threonine-protein kinase At3g14840 isoform X3 [Triticum dicoccoides]
MEVASPSDRDPQAGLHPSAGSSSSSNPISSRDSNMVRKLQNAACLTMRVLQQITDNFSEKRKIGQGAYGTVYKGVHASGEEIAVKLFHNNLQGTDDEQFKQECDGLDWHTRYEIIKGTCEGLKYLHEGFKEPIYHMDLKPDNILLDKNMMPKLADFGLSKLYDGEQSMITQSLAGTMLLVFILNRVPPEYLFEHVVSKKLDIFSLGVVVTKIITGPRGPTRRAEMTHQEFTNQVHVNWRKRLQETWHASRQLEAYCNQVKICIQIALTCMENDRHKRPTIVDIIHKLNQTEIVIKELKNDQAYRWTSNNIIRDVVAQGSDQRDYHAVHDENPSLMGPLRSISENIERVENEYSDEEDDPLPGVEGLRITGEAFPGRELQVSGYSINGTTSCKFEWVRHLEDGSQKFIEGARQPIYLVTADDVDTILAVEVQPLDDRERKGGIVKVYANEERKIPCDPETKELIKQTLSVGHVSYEVLLPAVPVLETWEPAVLAVTRKGYSIKCNGQRGVVATETFQQYMAISIPCGRPTEFSLQSADGDEYSLKPAENSQSRDTIVLILRAFRMQVHDEMKCRLLRRLERRLGASKLE